MTVRDPLTIALVDRHSAALAEDHHLVAGGAPAFSRRFLQLLTALQVPTGIFTPGSLRPGGVVRDFAGGRANLMDVMFHGRRESVRCLTRYLQMGLAAHAVLRLPPHVMSLRQELAYLLPELAGLPPTPLRPS